VGDAFLSFAGREDNLPVSQWPRAASCSPTPDSRETVRETSSNAVAELDMRLARGEIDAEDYAARKKLLNG